MRYQIVYNKRGFPLTAWTDSEAAARKMAARLRNAGYSVSVWAHTAEGVRKTEI